jgi:O-acetyl-ADP-ribose deacetylase (regulator of RNase III)
VLSHCTAVGFSIDEHERWPGVEEKLHVQAVGIPPYPGDRFPRVVGLVSPPNADQRGATIRMLRGDATSPQRDGNTFIAHIVNDKARRWGGHGFAGALGRQLPSAKQDYGEWAAEPAHRRLGAIRLFEPEPGLWVASMVAQAGYGEIASGRSRLRLPALAACLDELARYAGELGASVHMPAIGTGQGATPWPTIRDLILGSLVDDGVAVTVYVQPHEAMPGELQTTGQLTLV